MDTPGAPRWTTALVTGASSGIGRAFAAALVEDGTDVVVVARRRERLEELAAELIARHPQRTVEVLVADLLDPGERAGVEDRLRDPSRPIDLLVNNAGYGTHGRFWTLDVEREASEVELNAVVPLRLTHAVLAGMVERGRGAVVNVSSLVSVKPISMWATYAASKSFLTNFSRALDGEVRSAGVRVMPVMPGFTRTEFGWPDGFSRSVVPGPLWMSPHTIARGALRDLARGRDESIPGPHYRAFAHVARVTPRWLAHAVVKLATRDMWRRSPAPAGDQEPGVSGRSPSNTR